MRLLLIEDEKDIAEPLQIGLKKKGFAIDWDDTGSKGYKSAQIDDYDCIILDLNLPDMDGIQIAKKLREQKIFTPILILTARAEQEDVLTGFESGTDDYLTKPFDFQELVYRINSLIKRSSLSKDSVVKINGLHIDLEKLRVFKNNKPIDLNSKEIGILQYLVRNRGKVVSQEELLEHVWDREIDTLSQTIRTNVKTLRQKIDPEKKIIKNIRGQGYVVD